jgi:hypothetical protein
MRLEKPCCRWLDEPVLVWLGLEFHEVAIGVGAGTALALAGGFVLGLGFVGIVAGLALGAGLLAFFRALRRGGPGAVFARAYRAGIIELLPAALRPPGLLPVPRRGSVLRLSAVPEERDDPNGRSVRRRYFGK